MSQQCTLCDAVKVPNGPFLMCPHCDIPCHRSTPQKQCETCKKADRRTRP